MAQEAPIVDQAQAVLSPLGATDSAIVMGVNLETKFIMEYFHIAFKNLGKKVEERHFAVLKPEICDTAFCSNLDMRYAIIKVKPGTYALSHFTSRWPLLPDTNIDYFFDKKDESAKPSILKFTVKPGEITYIGNYTVRPKLDSYRHYYPQIITDISPEISNYVSKIAFKQEEAQQALASKLSAGAKFVLVRPTDTQKGSLHPTLTDQLYEDVYFNRDAIVSN